MLRWMAVFPHKTTAPVLLMRALLYRHEFLLLPSRRTGGDGAGRAVDRWAGEWGSVAVITRRFAHVPLKATIPPCVLLRGVDRLEEPD